YTGWRWQAELACSKEPQGHRAGHPSEHMHRHCTDWVVDAELLERLEADDHRACSNHADEEGSDRLHPVAGAGNRDETGQKPIHGEAQVPLPTAQIRVEQSDQAGRASGQRCVEGHTADAGGVQGGEGASWIEPVPAEPQNKAPDRAEDDGVWGHCAAAVAAEDTPNAWAQGDSAG